MILDYLFYNYGKVRSEEVAQKEAEVISIIWQPTDHIVLLTRALEQLQKLVMQEGIPYTNNQILEKGLLIVRVIRGFEYVLIQWEDKDTADKA